MSNGTRTWLEHASTTHRELANAHNAIRRQWGKRRCSLTLEQADDILCAIQHAQYLCEHIVRTQAPHTPQRPSEAPE